MSSVVRLSAIPHTPAAVLDAPTAPGRVLVVHPDPEHALARAAVVDHAAVDWATRGSQAVAWIGAHRPTGVALVHLRGTDRFRGGWPGHRLIERLGRRTGAPVVAWVSPDDADGRALAYASGATAVLTSAELHGVPFVEALARASAWAGRMGPAGLDPAAGDVALARWFHGRYGAPWEPWIEHAAACIACGGERAEQAESLRASLQPATTEHARRRLRRAAELLCGEIRGNEIAVAREAINVLARIAQYRPIAAVPVPARSLQRAARLLESDPTVAVEAGIPELDVADLLAVAREESSVVLSASRRRGRPEAGAWRARREVAVGRVAERRGTTRAEKLAAVERLSAVVADVVDLVHDTVDDRDRAAGQATHELPVGPTARRLGATPSGAAPAWVSP